MIGIRETLKKNKTGWKCTQLMGLYTSACNLENKQEELELGMWSEKCNIVGITEIWLA